MEELKTKVQETIVDKKWCVYIHINKINGKKYIGQTCQDLDDRWKNGNGYQRNPYFWNAIKKYGWDSFEHKVLSSNLTLEEANTIEEYYISLFDTTNKEYGYNMQSGGKNKLHIQATKEKIRSAH